MTIEIAKAQVEVRLTLYNVSLAKLRALRKLYGEQNVTIILPERN